MKISRRQILSASIATAAGLAAHLTRAAPSLPAALPSTPAQPKLPDPPAMLQQALAALERHSPRITIRDRLGIADFTEHSKEMRFHIVDVQAGKVDRSYLVSHGKGSDPANTGFAQRFSNRPGSNASSKGSFLTGETYYGKHGLSRRLYGLEEQNDHALARAIVIHGADYVDREMAIDQGRIGRSLGCFAVERSEIGEVLELLGPGRLLFSAG